MYIARNDGSKTQTIKEHSYNTAELAYKFSIDELKETVYNYALFHDIGKYQPTFQRRINGENVKINHAVCGALESKEIFDKSILSVIMQYCIAGHHSGLQDYGSITDSADQSTLQGNLKRCLEDYSFYKNEIFPIDVDKNKAISFLKKDCTTPIEVTEKLDFIIRYCFSCLTDADSIDSANFAKTEKVINKTSDFNRTLCDINDLLDSFTPITKLQKSRSLLQNIAFSKAKEAENIMLLNMPTGSGKTFCSLKIALETAINTNKKRIIYVIPYNSIIDQTSEVFEQKFKELNILRHQSSFSYEEDKDYNEDYREWAKYAIENWDGDFIITTAVQFFESIYKNKRGKLRKLHNMGDSIIIFDEAHLMPMQFLRPCLVAISNITKLLNSKALFLTATMPNFKKLIQKEFALNVEITDLIEEKSLFSDFNTCNYHFREFTSIEELLFSDDSPSKLIIVNKKKKAKEIYEKLSGECYHLSTYMTGKDRYTIISTIKNRLKQLDIDFPICGEIPDDRKITVVSTSLIEAGVDLDFHSVLRELTGLSSILQSGGRCNREGKRTKGNVTVFSIGEEKFSVEQSLSKLLMEKYEDINCPECIDEYYNLLLEYCKEDIISNAIYRKGQLPHHLNFKSYAEKFNLIDDEHYSIVVPQDEFSSDIMRKAMDSGKVNPRKLQKYTVSIAIWEFEELLKQGVLNDFSSGIFFLTNNDYYTSKTGIQFSGTDKFI